MNFSQLTSDQKSQVKLNIAFRIARFKTSILRRRIKPAGKVIIVGDRPGPAAPDNPDHGHTPFPTTTHCSGWLNALLYVEEIVESDLIWVNAYEKDGNPTDLKLLDWLMPQDAYTIAPAPIITLGANAAKWVKSCGYESFVQTTHPQYHKRFRNGIKYDLPELIRSFVERQYD